MNNKNSLPKQLGCEGTKSFNVEDKSYESEEKITESHKEGMPHGAAKLALKFIVEGQEFETLDQFKSGKELKDLVGIPLETELFLSIDKPYEDELVQNEKEVNLARPSTEYFFVKKKLKLKILDVTYEWYKQWITRAEIIILGKLDQDDEIYLASIRPWVDTLVTGVSVIDLSRPGIEHFYVKGNDIGYLVAILVNGKTVKIKRGKYTAAEIKALSGVDPSHDLAEDINGQLTPLTDITEVFIKGGEIFFSHPRDGASS